MDWEIRLSFGSKRTISGEDPLERKHNNIISKGIESCQFTNPSDVLEDRRKSATLANKTVK